MQNDKKYKKTLVKMFLIENLGQSIYKTLASKTSDEKKEAVYKRLALNEAETANHITAELKKNGLSVSALRKNILQVVALVVFLILSHDILENILKKTLKKRIFFLWFNMYHEYNKCFWQLMLDHEKLQYKLLNLNKRSESMTNKSNFPLLFRIVGVYDILLGLSFLLFYKNIYQALTITLPNHPGYIFVPALFLVCGGVGEFLIADNPLRNIDLVKIRLLMKLAFAAAVLYCYFTVDVPIIFLLISILSIIGVVKNWTFLKWAAKQKAESLK